MQCYVWYVNERKTHRYMQSVHTLFEHSFILVGAYYYFFVDCQFVLCLMNALESRLSVKGKENKLTVRYLRMCWRYLLVLPSERWILMWMISKISCLKILLPIIHAKVQFGLWRTRVQTIC